MTPPTSASTSSTRTRVVLGKIVGAHGLRGELRVRYHGDGPENLLRAPQVGLGASPDDTFGEDRDVTGARPGRPGEVRLALSGVDDRDAALSLRGSWIVGYTAELAPLAPGEHYWHELVGCRVLDLDGTPVGVIRELWETGAHDVLVVEDDRGTTHLLPAAEDLLQRVDPGNGVVVMEIRPGMLSSSDGLSGKQEP